MEGLPYDFGIEDDSSDDNIEKKAKKRNAATAETLAVAEPKPEVKPEKPSKERLLESEREPIDVAPELEGEASLDLNPVESGAIAQTMAVERRAEIQANGEELSSELLAVESLLDNIEANGGDINAGYSETEIELGDAPLKPASEVVASETDRALPVDPESLVEAAKSELNPDISYSIKRNETASDLKPTPEATPSRPPKDRREARADKLLDGIVDYLIGRRQARISAEHRHDEEIENRLRDQVVQIRTELVSRETQVRQLAKNKVIEKPERPKAVKPAKAESIGKVLVDSELPASEQLTDSTNELAGISAHTMKHTELLKVAQHIKIEGSSLRQMYDAHLLGEKGLRRVVAEYLRGGNFKRTLRRELLEREKDFERDPKLRDQATSQPVATSHVELDDLLQKSGIDWAEPQPTINTPKVKSSNLPAFLNEVRTSGSSIRRVADIVMIGIIFTMAAVITILILSR